MNPVYRDQALKKSAIYKIIKKFKAGKNTTNMRHNNPKKTKRTNDLIGAVDAAIKKDRCLTVAELAAATGVAYATIYRVLMDELDLVKKLARGVPKLLTDEQKQQ